MLQLRAVTAGYDRRAPVVRDVSLTAEPGKAVGLLGPSGCGKSTPAAEPLRATGRRDTVTERVAELAATVGLTLDLLSRGLHEVSDGQLQHACLARALVLRPRRRVCDEMTAVFDASTTATRVDTVENYQRFADAGLLAVGHGRMLLNEILARRSLVARRLPRAA
ncbi:ATP-binding cassette domain-containing protein [Streptomyces sp. NPDC006655]|uniref:ATP-binding cassette domain-containing protein n=1 Tax=Streptomyces sp. NPDC006655 TaxID=3156898 RepID=UPI00345557AE